MLFNNNKKVKVQYFLNKKVFKYELQEKIPLGLYKNLQFLNTKNTGCPAIQSSSNRVLNLFPPVEVDLEIYDADTNPQYKYTFNKSIHPTTNDMHDFVTSLVGIIKEKNNLVHLQILQPVCFLTDDKELEIVTVPPNIEVKNLEYISGAMKPYYWIRNLNTTYKIIDNTKNAHIKIKIDKPIMTYVFNKSIKLEYVDTNKTIENYYDQNKRIIQYRLKLNSLYKDIVTRRPKKLLT